MAIIEARNISKSYPLRAGARALFGRGGLTSMLRNEGRKTFNALEDLSLEVDAGESLGIIGRNGSGKSTLLKILAGVTLPTTGEVRVQGRVASLLELGAGFHPMLTGRENVYLNAGLLGMRHAAVDEVFDEIVAFSGIGEFIDQPVDTYSSGMYVRIAFAVAVHANPDIFLVDEVLAVGDEEFQRQCRVKIGELKEAGKTIVFVSHDLGIVNTLCDRVVLLDHGKKIARDSAQATIDFYLRQIGRASGIHTMRDGRLEAIFSHGRIALFFDGKEVTSPSGWSCFLRSLEQIHDSSQADWRIHSRTETSCSAEGRLPRLPAVFKCDIRLQDNRVHFSAGIDVEKPFPLDALGSHVYFPVAYREWMLGEDDGAFPDIDPTDTTWTNLLATATSAGECTLLPAQSDGLPPVTVRLDRMTFPLAQRIHNTDYITGARVVTLNAHVSSSDAQPQPGAHHLFDLVLDLGSRRDDAVNALAEKRKAASLSTGPAAMHVHGGQWKISWDGKPVTTSTHGHVEMKVQGIWCMSQELLWSPPARENDRLTTAGNSVRFGYRLSYAAEARDDGFAVQVRLHNDTPLNIEEYNATLAVDPSYERWKTDHEEGEFPPFNTRQSEWRHLNRDYHPGAAITAAGSRRPRITLQSDDAPVPMRMSALLAPSDLGAHMIQAIASPGQRSHFHYEPGEHLLFSGRIVLEKGGG